MAIFVYQEQIVYQIQSANLDELGEFAGTKRGLAIALILTAIGTIIAILTLFTSVGKSTYSFIKSRLVGYHDNTKEEVAPQAHHRHFLLNKVRNQWINDILHNSLHNVAIIELGLDECRDKIDLLSNLVVRQPNCDPRDLPSSARILDIFDELGGSFLILGEPGSGKTTILLRLAEKLLDRADADGNYPIPVVFNLSTWAIQRLPFEEWLVEDMQLQYGIGKTLGKKWVKDDLILPLLDGLDEVALEHRQACVEAINHFRSEHGLVPLIVCSRTEEYDALNSRLNLPTAILVKPLTSPQIYNYIGKIGASMDGVRVVLQDDKTLWELLYAPFMLNIVTLAFKDKPPEYIQGTGTIEERRKKIFDAYKDAMFGRPLRSTTRNYSYSRHQVDHWLSWLAKSMKRHNLSVFYLEHIQLDWLPSSQQETLKKENILMTGLVYGLVFGLVYGLAELVSNELSSELIIRILVFGLFSWLGFGLGSWLVFGPNTMLYAIKKAKAERLQFNRSNLVYGLVIGLVIGLVFLLITGLITGLIIGLTYGLTYGLVYKLVYDLVFGLILGLVIGLVFGPNTMLYAIKKAKAERLQFNWSNLAYGLTIGLGSGLVIGLVELVFGVSSWLSNGLVFGLILGLVFGPGYVLETKELDARRYPNEGIHRSAKNAVFVGLVYGLVGLFFFGLSFELSSQLLAFGMIFGPVIGLISGLVFGGYECIQHYLLRIAFQKHNLAPLSYVDFLDYAADRIFLRKVGGGYLFIHRMILDYFASLEPD